MSAFDPPPSYFDPEWLSRQTLESICREGSDATNVEWIRRLYAWIYVRSPASRSWPKSCFEPEGPPRGFFPVLLAPDGTAPGRLSFLSVSYIPRIVENHTSASSTEAAANWAWEWFQDHANAEHNPGGAEHAFYVRVNRPRVDGESDGLAAFVAILIQTISPASVDDVCATGKWNAEKKCFEPVSEFLKKVKAAEEWGYRRMFCVAGQNGVNEIQSGMQIIIIPIDPLKAASVVRNAIDPLSQRIRRGMKGWLVAALFAAILVAAVKSKFSEYAALIAAVFIGLNFIGTIRGTLSGRTPIQTIVVPMLGLIAASCLVVSILCRVLDAPSKQIEIWFVIDFIGLMLVLSLQWVWHQVRSV